jgi:hypothetical protein
MVILLCLCHSYQCYGYFDPISVENRICGGYFDPISVENMIWGDENGT